jgi:hypothetical protein
MLLGWGAGRRSVRGGRSTDRLPDWRRWGMALCRCAGRLGREMIRKPWSGKRTTGIWSGGVVRWDPISTVGSAMDGPGSRADSAYV